MNYYIGFWVLVTWIVAVPVLITIWVGVHETLDYRKRLAAKRQERARVQAEPFRNQHPPSDLDDCN